MTADPDHYDVEYATADGWRRLGTMFFQDGKTVLETADGEIRVLSLKDSVEDAYTFVKALKDQEADSDE